MFDLIGAFPSGLRNDAELALRALVPAISDQYYEKKEDREIVHVCGEGVWLPRRLHDKIDRHIEYYDERPFKKFEKIAQNRGLNTLQKQIFLCLLTRHHNGFVREPALKHIIVLDEPWVIPYVVQLASEYVYEILAVIKQNLDQLHPGLYGEFFRNNPIYFAKVKQRVVSYWNVYYRWYEYTSSNGQVHHSWRERYLGHEIVDRFNEMAMNIS